MLKFAQKKFLFQQTIILLLLIDIEGEIEEESGRQAMRSIALVCNSGPIFMCDAIPEIFTREDVAKAAV